MPQRGGRRRPPGLVGDAVPRGAWEDEQGGGGAPIASPATGKVCYARAMRIWGAIMAIVVSACASTVVDESEPALESGTVIPTGCYVADPVELACDDTHAMAVECPFPAAPPDGCVVSQASPDAGWCCEP